MNRKKMFMLLVSLLCVICNAQLPEILHGDLKDAAFVGYDNGYPMFYKVADEYGLYLATRSGDSVLNVKRVRESKFPVWSSEILLIWVNNDIEIYTKKQSQEKNNKDFIIATKDGIDSVSVELNSFYDYDYEPFAITNDRKTLFAVQPGGYQNDNLGWYYDSIMKIDLTKKPLVAEKLPITGIEIHIEGDFLYYKGGDGINAENEILRVEIDNWEKVDTLTIYSYFWFVYNNVLYVHTGGYSKQDEWIGLHFEQKFIAYSINEKKCAIISEAKPRYSDKYPILFEGEYYNPFSGGLYKIPIPKITKFPYKQTLPIW